MNLLIKNATIVDSSSIYNNPDMYDILIENGVIQKIESNINADGFEIIDAKGKYVLPGLVDMHCHLRDPGYEYKEDIVSGARSAAKGGFTSIACMPNTNPVIDDKTVVSYVVDKAKKNACVNVYPIAAISKGLDGEQLTEVGALKEAGAVAISDDGKPVKSASFMKKALKYSSYFDIPVISHCEDLSLVDGGVMNEGEVATRLGLRGIPNSAEDLMIAREIILAEETGIHIHIAHVSTKTGIQLIREAKARGVNITCETCPHYFALTDEACEGYNTFAKVNPPLRTKEDLEAVIEGLKDDTIDVIATDHAPHHIDEKNVEFNHALNGLVGFETAFSLANTLLVKPGHLELVQLVDKMSTMPADILNIPAGRVEVGTVADLVIVDLDVEYKFDASSMESKSFNTPFDKYPMIGRVEHTIVGGNMIMKSRKLEV